MAFDNAKRILTNEDARIASSAEGIYDDDLVILFWENVEAHHIDECVRYLNSTGQRVVSSGTTFYDVTFDDALHHLHAYYQETDQRIYRVLMRSSITTSSITQSDTKWRLQSGETYEAGTSNLVLAMYNVDPNSIVSLETESLNETYTSIYLLGGTELTGTWFNVARESEYNSQTGLYDLRWYISRYQTKEYIFATKGDQVKNIVDFFKHHMTASSIDDFEGNYYFDSATLGDYYYSTDGNDYTKKNDVAATGSLPATAKNIITEVSGRSVSYEQRPDRENGEVDIFLKLIFNQELSSTANSDFQEYTETVVRKRNALSVDSVGTPADGTQVTIEANVNDDGTFDVLKRTRVFNQQSATSGSTSAFQSESVVITNNASTEADAPSDQSDGTIVRSESEQLPNGKFRNIVRTTVARTDVADVTDESTTGNDSGAGFTETTVKKYNQASAETIGADEDAAGTTVIVENTINQDGTFNTIKRTRVEREAEAASGTKGVLSSEAVVITNNAASALAQAGSTTAGTTKIHESQQLENGLFRNIQRTITSHANDGSTDKIDQTGSSETILRKYNQATALAHDASEEADGTTITIENTINADGTFNTVKRTRVDSELSATGGSANAFRNEVVSITINANAQLGQPSDPTNGVSTIHESEQLPNGLFRNTVRTITARSDVGTVTDERSSGADDGAGFTEVITKKYNQSTAESVGESDDGAGKTVTVENTINEDGTFNTVKSIKTDRESTAAGGSTNAFRSESVVITNNASSQLTAPSDQSDGTILIHESEQLPNGLFRNIVRTITARTDVATVTDETTVGDDDDAGYTETVVKKYNQSSPETLGTADDASGRTVVVENTINEDGTFNTIKRTRNDRSRSATSGTANNNYTETRTVTTNAPSGLGAPNHEDGKIKIHESEQLENGKYRNVQIIREFSNISTITDKTVSGNEGGAGYTETVLKKYKQDTELNVSSNEDVAGTTITIENTIREDGKFDTIKRTRVDRESEASSGTKGTLTSETVTITNNASQELAQDSTAEVGKTKINTSEQLANGLFRNVARVITSHANNGSTDVIDQTGSSEEIIKKYNQANPLSHDQSEEDDGKTITVENTINPDGTYNTIKRTRTDVELAATSGTVNNNFSEVRTVTVNAASQAGTPTHEDGKIKINESEKLPNGLFRNVEIVRTFTAIDDITDKEIVGTEAPGGGGYTETVTKQYKQSTALAHDINEDAAGKTITIENTIREDGTFDIVKRVREERHSTGSAESESAANSTTIEITNNASAQLGAIDTPADGTTITQESTPIGNGRFRNVKTTVVAKSQTALNKTISGKDPHLFFNGYNSYLEFENTEYQQQQKVGTYLIDFEFPEDYKPVCIADGLGDFDLADAEPLSNKVYLFSTIDGQFLGESTVDQAHLRNAVHIYLRTGEINDTIAGVSGNATSEDQLNIYLVIKVRHDEYPQGELSKTVQWNHGQRRIRIAYSADCLGYTSYEFGRRPRFVIENVPASSGTPTAAYNTPSGVIVEDTKAGVNTDQVYTKDHTMFPFRIGSGYYGGDSETSGSTDAEQVSLRSEKFLLYSFHYYNSYLEDTDLQAWCDSKTLPAFQPSLSIDPSLGSNIIDSQIKDIALKEEYRQGRTIVAGEPYRIEDLGGGSTAITENSGVNSTSDYQYYPGRAQVIIPESETSNTGARTSYFIDSASRSGQTITINLSSNHGKTGTWEPTQTHARIIVTGLTDSDYDPLPAQRNPNKKFDSSSGGPATITFTDSDTITIVDTDIDTTHSNYTASDTYNIKEERTAVVGSWFKAAVGGSLGSSVIVAADYIPDTTRFHNANVIGDVFVAGGSREETVEVNTSNTEQKFITDGGTVADPKSGEEKSIINEVLPDGKYRTTITTRKSKLQSAVSEVSSSGESSTTTINLRSTKQESAETPAAGKVITVENIPNDDGTFRTVKTITSAKNLTATSSTQIGENGLTESIVINTANSMQKFAADNGDIADAEDGEIKTIDNQPLPDGKFRTVVTTRNIADKEYGILTQASQEVQSLDLTFKDVTAERKDQILQRIKVDEDGNWWEVSTDGGSTVLKKNGDFSLGTTLPSDAKLISEPALFHGREVQSSLSCNEQTNLWTVRLLVNFYEANTDYSTGSPLDFKIDATTSMKVYMAFNLTGSALATWEGYFNNTSNIGDGITRQMNPPVKNEHGRWDVQAIELIKTGINTSFTVGKKKYFYGYHFPKKPKTTGEQDALTVNINGNNNNLPATAVLNGNTKEEDDGTFSWLFSYEPQVSVEYGASSPQTSNASLGSGKLIQYGDPLEKIIWKGVYSEKDLVTNGIDLTGEYTTTSIAGVSSGTYNISGTKLEKNVIRNERIDSNGKVSYSVYRKIISAEINGTTDEWYLMSATESFDRKKQTVSTLTTTGNVTLNGRYHKYSTLGTIGGSGAISFNPTQTSYSFDLGQADTMPSANSQDEEADQTKTLISADTGDATNTATDYSIPTYHLIEAVTKRRKTVSIFRKYFVRRPTNADLNSRAFNSPATPNDLVSIKTVMDNTIDEDSEADIKLARSFQVIKAGNQYALEMREVRQSVVHSYDMDAISKIVSQETLDRSTSVDIGATSTSMEVDNTGANSTYGLLKIKVSTSGSNTFKQGDLIKIEAWTGDAITEDGIKAPINGDHIVEASSGNFIYIKIPRLPIDTQASDLGHSGRILKYKARLCTGYQEVVGGHFRASAGMLEEDLNSTDTFKDKVHGEMN